MACLAAEDCCARGDAQARAADGEGGLGLLARQDLASAPGVAAVLEAPRLFALMRRLLQVRQGNMLLLLHQWTALLCQAAVLVAPQLFTAIRRLLQVNLLSNVLLLPPAGDLGRSLLLQQQQTALHCHAVLFMLQTDSCTCG